MALIYLGYKALKKKMGDGEEEPELTEEEKMEQLQKPVETSKATSVGGAAGGAALGTMILPGVGTAIGAGVGALVGKKKSQKDKTKKEQQNLQELERMKQESLKKQKAEQAPSDFKVERTASNASTSKAGSSETKPEVSSEKPPPAYVAPQKDESKPEAKPRQIKYEYHEVIVIKTGQTMGLHIKKNEQTGEIFVSNIVPGSDAEQSNVQVNDIIDCINGIQLKNESIHECANLMSNSKEYVDFKLKRILQAKE